MDFARQAKFLGFGYRTNVLGFRKLNHALKVLWISQIARVSMTAQFLNLGNKVPRELGTLLPKFRETVLKPALRMILVDMAKTTNFVNRIGIYYENPLIVKELEKQLTQLFEEPTTLDNLLLYCNNKLDLTIRVQHSPLGLRTYKQSELGLLLPVADAMRILLRWHDQEGLRPFEKAVGHAYDLSVISVYHDEANRLIGAMAKAVNMIALIDQSYSMDSALRVYFELIKLRASTDARALRLEPVLARSGNSALPLQARLFRN